MKEIKSDGIFEKKIRIYEPFRLDELNEFYQKHKNEYKNINQLFVRIKNLTEKLLKCSKNKKNEKEDEKKKILRCKFNKMQHSSIDLRKIHDRMQEKG